MEIGKYKIRVLADSVPGDSLPNLQTVTFALCPPLGERERELSGGFSYKGANPLRRGLHPSELTEP